ncbi:MAG: AMP-binding protein [Lachnospiraceae bacterium]|nr:AMP-binding protein [Lachnospiraceae bacterium]
MSNQLETFLRADYEKWRDRAYLHEKQDGEYKAITFGAFIEQVNYLAAYLLEHGYQGKTIGIFGANCTEWMIADIAIMNYVGVSAGLSKEWNYDNLVYALKKCEISCLFYHEGVSGLVERLREEYTDIRYISMQQDFADCIEEGKKAGHKLFDLAAKDADAPAKIVFTSGTTSFPKAVLLSVRNVFAGWRSLGRRVPLCENDVCYLFLPLNHTYGSIFNFIYSLVFGYEVYLAESVADMAQEMMAVRPTVFSGVPIIYMRFYEGAKAAGIGLKDMFGGRMKYLFCGGAKLSADVRNAYKAEGIYMMNAYALSETASSFSIDYPGEEDMESVGTVFEDMDVKVLDADAEGYGELAAKGEGIFLGYYNEEEATRNAFSEDGYFLTGDIGCIRDHKVYVRGRKDTTITLPNGENVSTHLLEERVKGLHEGVAAVKVYVRNEQLTCDIYVDQKKTEGHMPDWDKLFEELNPTVPKYERIKKYTVYDSRNLLK